MLLSVDNSFVLGLVLENLNVFYCVVFCSPLLFFFLVTMLFIPFFISLGAPMWYEFDTIAVLDEYILGLRDCLFLILQPAFKRNSHTYKTEQRYYILSVTYS